MDSSGGGSNHAEPKLELDLVSNKFGTPWVCLISWSVVHLSHKPCNHHLSITISLTIQQSPSKQINHFIASIFLTAFHQPCTEWKRYEDTCPGPSLPNPSNFPRSIIALEWHFWTILCPNSPSCYWVGKHDWLGMGYLLYAASEHIYLARDLMRGRHLFLGLGNYWFGHTSFWFQHECSTILLVIVFQRKCLSSLVENLDRQGNLSQLPYHH